eukprot:1190263-Prorocentrum_minimum.AAC.6
MDRRLDPAALVRPPGQRATGAPLLVWPSAGDSVRLADTDPVAARELLGAALGAPAGSLGTVAQS